ncbi:helix-turn-helix protein [Pseudonocardia endophytica]|uniref:Helix-turn-helix protein n=2 Tax=Pseudonocardia endophytica TaxID=401976 RepID=A0A4R1HX35_PSEEN|nr:helix-turn-helix protein [Pseudonocardia endophytica]
MVETARSLSGWSDLIRERFVPLDITPHGAPDLRGAVRYRHLGRLQVAAVRSAPQTFRRTRSQAAVADDDLLAIGVIADGTGCLEQDGRSCVVSGGEFALYDTSRPFSWSLDGTWDMRVYTWPRTSLPFLDEEIERLTARTVTRDSAIGALVTPMLHQLSDVDAPDLSPVGAARLSGEVAELAVIAASEHVPPGRAVHPDDDLFARIQEFVRDNLNDPLLGAESIARELFVSTRTLHRMFARRDLTLANWIKELRLDACRRALCSHRWEHVPIGQIAARHGFTNASFFSREFTARFGTSPRRYRQGAI